MRPGPGSLDDDSRLEGLRDRPLRAGAVDGVRHPPGLRPVGRHVFDLQQENKGVRKCRTETSLSSHHVGLLSKSSAADLTHEGFLPRVDLQMLLEVESFRIDKKSTDWTALVIRPAQEQY